MVAGRAALVALILLALAFAAPAWAQPPLKREALVKMDLVWLKVAAEVPVELVATEEYMIPVQLSVTEVEGSLKVFYLKGLRFTLDSSVLEWVPDAPTSLDVGRVAAVTVRLAPRFFAAQMLPGDVKDTSLKIDISYYYEATGRDGRAAAESGYYSVFANIPVRVIAPRTYVYVQPSMDVAYEPYLVRFFVDVWVEGEGFIENAIAEVSGAPVQCYLLTTGRVRAGEQRRLEFLMNVSQLGPFARSQYNVQLRASATTPWGYTYTYTYPLTLSIKPLREVSLSLPSLAVANALTPVTIGLNPPLDRDEQATVSIYWGARLVHSGGYSRTVYVAFPEGNETVTVRVDSSKYAPATARAAVATTTVEPRVSAYVMDSILYVRAAPLYQGASVEVRVVDESRGTVAFQTTMPASALSPGSTSIGGALTAEGVGSVLLDLGPGRYTVYVTYSTGSATKVASIPYEIPGSTVVGGLPLPLPLPIIILIVAAAAGVAVIVIVLRRRRGGAEEEVE